MLTPALRVGPDAVPGEGAPDIDETDPDDEALRALVRAIIEEELQGPLGERITRAVRRLVRAEVTILLASRSAD